MVIWGGHFSLNAGTAIVNLPRHNNFCFDSKKLIMKKLLFILLGSLAMACGDASDRSEARETAADEDVEIGSGEAISPQLDLDSADRFDVDTISSSESAREVPD